MCFCSQGTKLYELYERRGTRLLNERGSIPVLLFY